MTLIAALSISDMHLKNTIILTGDSRVTFYSENGKLESYSDKGQKVFSITENVFIGFAGDFFNINKIVANLRKKLLKPKPLQPVILNRSEFIVKEISNFLKQEWSHEYSDSSLLIVIRDLTDGRVKLYQADAPNFDIKKLDKGLHLIGGDDVDRIKFRHTYKTLYDFLSPKVIDHYAISIWSAFQEVVNTEINGLNPCYLIQGERWTTLHRGFSDDGGQNWIADAATNNGNWERQVNGKQVSTTELDFNKVMDEKNRIKRK